VFLLEYPLVAVELLSGSRADKAARDPFPKLLMVHTAVSPDVLDPDAAETVALWTAVVNQLGRNG